jgi:ribosomal protein L40E
MGRMLDERTCAKCGVTIPVSQKFCRKCQDKKNEEEEGESFKSIKNYKK